MGEPNGVVGVPQVEVEGDAPHYDQTEVHLQQNLHDLFPKPKVKVKHGNFIKSSMKVKVKM